MLFCFTSSSASRLLGLQIWWVQPPYAWLNNFVSHLWGPPPGMVDLLFQDLLLPCIEDN